MKKGFFLRLFVLLMLTFFIAEQGRAQTYQRTSQGIKSTVQGLRTVADTQNGVFPTNPAQIYLECTLIINRKGATRKDNSFYTLISVWKFVVRYNLAIDIQFAQPAADELRGLRTEIKNNNLLLHINPYRL